MWKLLLQAGVGFATFGVGRRIAQFKRTVTFLAIAGFIALFGVGALVTAAIIALAAYWGPLWSAVAVGGGLLVIAALIAFIGTRTPRIAKQPTPIVDRVRAELGAAGSALASARAARPTSEPAAIAPPPAPGARKKRAIN
ncbi:MAG: phage holin family protein, partial [Hansschlegelia sp.]